MKRGYEFGRIEPPWVRFARAAYYRHRAWRTAVEARIVATDSGMEWLMRVKRIGRTA